MSRSTVRRPVLRIRDGAVRTRRPDTLAGEEPLEIRLDGRPLTVTMRTPGDDFDLAAGFLVGEGVVHRAGQVTAIRYCAGATADGGNTYNVVDVLTTPGTAAPELAPARNFYTTSSCGICGRASLDAVRTTAAWTLEPDTPHLTPAGPILNSTAPLRRFAAPGRIGSSSGSRARRHGGRPPCSRHN